MNYLKVSFIFLVTLVILLFSHNLSVSSEMMTDEEVLKFCQQAADGISPVPGLSASDIHSSYEIKSKEEGSSSFLSVSVNQYDVAQIDDFQALFILDDSGEIVEIKPDTQELMENPEWIEKEISFAYDLNFGMKLKLLMETESYPYEEMKIYYEKLDDNRYRVRAQGENIINLEVDKESNRIIYYQNNMAVAGLEIDEELSDEFLEASKAAIQGSMTDLIELPDGAELNVATSVPWNKGIGTTANVYLIDLEYNHMMGEGTDKSQYYGDFISMFVNPLNQKLVLYNCKWMDL